MEVEPTTIADESELNFLTAEEKETVSTELFDKLKNEWNKKLQEIFRLQSDIEKTKAQSEQHEFQVEKQLVDLRKQLEDEGQSKSESQTQIATLREKLATHEEDLKKTNVKIATLSQQLQKTQCDHDTTSAQCTALSASLEMKSKVNDDLKEQVSTLQEQLATAQMSKCEALIQAEEATTSQLQFQYKEQRFEQEKALLTRQLEFLQEQLEQRSTEILSLRKENSTNLLTMQSDLNHVSEEARVLREERDALQKTIEEKSKRIEDLIKSLHETRDSETQLESTYKKELSAQEKLAAIYKQSTGDQQKRCEELEEAIEELNRLLQEASDQYGALEKAKQVSEDEAQDALDQRDLLIKDLKDELEKVNELLKCSSKDDNYLSELSPAASAACQLMNKGLTLSQLYNEYLNTCEKLLKSEDENKRQSRYMEQILREIEEKAPILRKQRDDYERALETINALHAQIDASVDEVEKRRVESEEASRRSNFLGRENGRLNRQVKDLSKQVAVLLTQVEAARAGLPPPPLSVFDSTPNGTTASEVIGEHLVAFRDVSELQEQNTKLLSSLREVTDKLETNEKEAIEARTKELQEELDLARKELDDLKSSRDRMQSMMENLTRQRDVYRTIVGQENKTISPVRTSKELGLSTQEVEKLKKDLGVVQKELEKTRREHEEYRQERSKNDQLERNEMEKLKSVFDQTRGENIKFLSQAEYNEERLKTLQKNCEAYQRQLTAVEENNKTLQGIVGRHEGTIESLREQTLNLTKKMSQAEMVATNLREEKVLLKESEARLLAERDSLQRSQYSQSLLLSNLEAIKNNLEKSDSGLRMRFENQVTDLTEQCCRLKAKIESNIDLKESQAKAASLEEQVKTLNGELSSIKEKLNQSVQQVGALKSQLKDAHQYQPKTGIPSPGLVRGRSAGSPQHSPSGPRPLSPAVTSTVRELQVQLSEERARISSLQSSNERNSANLKKASDTIQEQEAQLKASTETGKAAQEEITSLKKTIEELEAKVKELDENLKSAIESENALKEISAQRLMKITEDLEERENELEETQKKLEEAEEAEKKAMAEIKKQNEIAASMQDKYEKEVILHGADLKALGALKERLTDHNSQLENLTTAKLKAEESLSDLKTGFEDREAMLKKTVEELKSRTQELDEQNKVLLEQFTELSDKMGAIQTKLSTCVDGGNTFTEDEARSSEQLREIIKYLRREREVAVGKAEVAQAASLRLEAQKKSLEAQVDLLNKYLAEEREKNQANVETATRYSEMMRKVHMVDALADSNRLLREDKDQMRSSLEEAKAKVASFESQIEPLQDKLREANNKLDSITVVKKSLENEKELYKKRSQELVEKLNKARPEDMIKLQQECNNLQKSTQSKDLEINRLKNMLSQVQKNYQAAMVNKNQLQRNLVNARDEAKMVSEENKKLTQAKMILQQQAIASMEKIESLEASVHHTHTSQQQEQQKVREQKSQFVQQLVDVRQSEEKVKKELEATKKTLAMKETSSKDLEEKIVQLQKQNSQLRKIAHKYKYKNKVESSDSAETSTQPTEEECEDGKSFSRQSGDTPVKKEEMERLMEEISRMREEIQKRDDELASLKSQDTGSVSKLHSDLEQRTQELQKANLAHAQLKEKFTSELGDIRKTLDESHSKKGLYESRISTLEEEKEQASQVVKALTKKLSIQQKMLENLQKQTGGGQKVSPSVIMEKPPSDTPPTANIKPMAAPIPTPAVSSPRSQGTSQGSGSRLIPTASIRPMAPTVVSPMEAHSGGDGAVSSTVTLPQATVTPTPVAPPTLTATVSPTSVSQSSVASNVLTLVPSQPAEGAGVDIPVAPSSSGTADALISQAIALVSPQMDDRPPIRPKRKLESVQEEDEVEAEAEDSKRSRLAQEEAVAAEEERMEEDAPRRDDDEEEEDTGEPSSSSSHPGGRKVNDEILILSSDEEGEAPPSQSGRVEGEREEAATETGREAEAERSEEGEAPPVVIQPPPRPLHEPPSSSRQSLAPFHSLPQYEEGVDDRIVPSTPTLFVPRTGDGAAGDGVSSPQVPSRGFEFGSSSGESVSEAAAPSNDGVSQIAEGGAIEVTRMDLAQLDEGTHRSVPSTPMRRSPSEVTAEGNISSSGGDSVNRPRDTLSGPSSDSIVHSPEPDSIVHGGQGSDEQETPEDEEQPAERDEGDEEEEEEDEEEDSNEMGQVVSSQQEPLDTESERGEQPHEEDLGVEEEEEEEEEDGGEEEEDHDEEAAEGEGKEESSFQPRATRSTSAAPPPAGPSGRRITPIMWSEDEGGHPVRSFARGSPRISRYSQPPSRRMQRARRSRPSYSKRGGNE